MRMIMSDDNDDDESKSVRNGVSGDDLSELENKVEGGRDGGGGGEGKRGEGERDAKQTRTLRYAFGKNTKTHGDMVKNVSIDVCNLSCLQNESPSI